MGVLADLRTREREQGPARASSSCSPARTHPMAARAAGAAGFFRPPTRASSSGVSGDPVLFLSNPDGVTRETRRQSLDLLKRSQHAHQADVGDPEIATRIASYELAYRMQSSVPELTDISKEPPHDPRDVRHRAGQELIREQLPARPAPGRTRRPVRAALPPRLGHARHSPTTKTSSTSCSAFAARRTRPRRRW